MEEVRKTAQRDDKGFEEALMVLVELAKHGGTDDNGWREWEERAAELRELRKQDAEEAEKRLTTERVKSWRGWVENDQNQGGKNAHAMTLTPVEWQPTTVQEDCGYVTSDKILSPRLQAGVQQMQVQFLDNATLGGGRSNSRRRRQAVRGHRPAWRRTAPAWRRTAPARLPRRLVPRPARTVRRARGVRHTTRRRRWRAQRSRKQPV